MMARDILVRLDNISDCCKTIYDLLELARDSPDPTVEILRARILPEIGHIEIARNVIRSKLKDSKLGPVNNDFQ